MSELDPQVPPAGEDIHLPGGSLQPLILAFGTMVALIGITTKWWIAAFGLIVFLWALVLWIRDARHEYAELPAHHGSH